MGAARGERRAPAAPGPCLCTSRAAHPRGPGAFGSWEDIFLSRVSLGSQAWWFPWRSCVYHRRASLAGLAARVAGKAGSSLSPAGLGQCQAEGVLRSPAQPEMHTQDIDQADGRAVSIYWGAHPLGREVCTKVALALDDNGWVCALAHGTQWQTIVTLSCFVFSEVGVCILGFALAKQALHHLSHTSSPFCSGYFGGGGV
jgi:hypothetical protein